MKSASLISLKRYDLLLWITAVSLIATAWLFVSLANAAPTGEPDAIEVSITTDPSDAVKPGDRLTYTINVSNDLLDSKEFSLTSQIPENTTLVYSSPNADVMGMPAVSVALVTQTLAASDSAALIFAVEVDEAARGEIVNVTDINVAEEAPYDPITTITEIIGNLNLSLPVVQFQACPNELDEPNDSVDDLDPKTDTMTLPQAPIVSSFCRDGDEDDWYRLSIEETADLQVSLQVDPAQDLDLFLYDESVTLIGRSNVTGAGVAEQIQQPVSPGIYYVRVFPFDISNGGYFAYELTLSQP